MSSTQRTSANVGRRAHGTTPSLGISGSFRDRIEGTSPGGSQTFATTNIDTPAASSTQNQANCQNQLYDNDTIVDINTKLNQALEDADKYRELYEQTANKLADAMDKTSRLSVKLQRSADDKNDLRQEITVWSQNYAALEAQYHALNAQKRGLGTPGSSTLPDRSKPTKPSRTGSKKEHRDDRGRGRDREKSDHKATEKEYASRRLVDDHRRPPTTSSNRHSYIEPWGRGGRSASATRAYDAIAAGRAVATTRMQAPVTSPDYHPSYSATPRTATVHGGGRVLVTGNGLDVYAGDNYESGNYHPDPLW